MWRYQEVHLRTSYWSSPTTPLTSAKLSSMVQRIPATRTSSGSDVWAGPNARKYARSVGSLTLRRMSNHCAIPGALAYGRWRQAQSPSRAP
jgi:hypothetical protein